ncbi:MAG: YgiQ family radical SAM protein [Clostridiales bacterium]|nr:YgiQ family radical SAM protein [Clostridiales bacterium]
MNNKFLPTTAHEIAQLGWDTADFVYVTGDAYVDHPSFGPAIITRVLENAGFRVAVLSQPDWKSDRDFTRLGRPKLGFFVSSGNLDSMVAHYTVAKHRRNEDCYTPGGATGKRPDRAVSVYCKKIREIYGDIPIIIGGLEASLRRFAHYDYWDDTVHPSILFESGADMISYGMGENQTREIARRLAAGENIKDMTDIRGTCYAVDVRNTPLYGAECPSFENVVKSEREYAVAARIQLDEQDHIRGKLLKQRHGSMMLVQNPPMPPLTTAELDEVYALPYVRKPHPSYEALGGVPGFSEVEFSIAHNRGCFGACNFCSLAFHQGRYVTSRSKESVIAEAKLLTTLDSFKGNIHDIGGPTANFRFPSCKIQMEKGLCKGKKCLAPKPCPNLVADHSEYLDILRSVRAVDGVKNVFIRSGIRYDYMLEDKDDAFFRELVHYHVSGRLKVAPEHCSAAVLDKMGKPHIEAYLKFSKKYFEYTKGFGKEQYIVPYLMSSHPGCSLKEAIELAEFLKREDIRPEQVQDFYPTPGTISTAMYHTGLDPYTLKPVYVAKNPHEKAMQRALLRYFDKSSQGLVLEALRIEHRYDLIGTAKSCLVPEPKGKGAYAPNARTAANSHTRAPGKKPKGGKSNVKRGKAK